ncbi:1008_t:CDS:1 [Dentiscutata erythropus]|uniref:1008_t:CDS:1 n=1 Tax=Dentiscutata erythropus TaxID=1348616 RepID=A0A9N9J9R9_9GLOM|nr:1008_t:CDS:1 [Dentiscutata erythropus]
MLRILSRFNGCWRCELNNLRKDIGKKYEEAQNYKKWMFDLCQNYRKELFSRFHVEINEKIMNTKDLRMKLILQDRYEQYKSRILQIAQRINRNLVPSKNKSADDITQKEKTIVQRLKLFTYGSKKKTPHQVLSIRDRPRKQMG